MTNERFTRFGGVIVTAVTLALCLAAPSAWAQKKEEKAAESRQDFRASILSIRSQIDATLNTLNEIPKGKDPGARKEALKNYDNEMQVMSKEIDKAKSYAKTMKEQGQAYFKEWEKSAKKVKNESLAASAGEQRAALQAQYEKIQAGIQQVKNDTSAFWKNLQDLQKYYGKDLSDAGIASTAELVTKSKADGKKAQEYLDQIVAAVDEVGVKLEK